LAIFGKFTDNWLAGTPRSGRWVASSSFDAVTVAAAVGCLIVLLAALCALPMFGSLVRSGHWKVLRGPLLRSVTSAAIAAVLLGGALAWAHHLSRHDRIGDLPV
jgi:ABC-type multidrug transport system permease subunit